MTIIQRLEDKIDEAKGHIAAAIELLREIPEGSPLYEERNIDNSIRDLEDIQIIRL